MTRSILGLLCALLPAAAFATTPPRLVPEPQRLVHDRLGGGSRSFLVHSRILGETRRVFVHLPGSFDLTRAGRTYPTIVVFDGEWLLRPVVAVSELLAEQGQIPEAVVVAIQNIDGASRLRDLTPRGLSVSGSGLAEGGDRFLDFVEGELLPALDAELRTSAPRVLIGSSSGGILATFAAATRETYRLVLALDAPAHLGDGWLGARLRARAAAARHPLLYASLEARFGWDDAEWARLAAAAPSSWRLHRERLRGESHESMQFLGAYLGLRELFREYSLLAAPEAPTATILPSYDALVEIYGARIPPPAPLIARVVDDLLLEGRAAEARAALATLTTAYGPRSDGRELETRISEIERMGPPPETVEQLLATPFPTSEEIGDYLGVWEGETWVRPEVRHRLSLRLEVRAGVVVGEMVSWPEPSIELVRPLQYLRVTEAGLSFGDLNGMRPRGLLLHEGKRTGDRLAGEVRFGGIRLVLGISARAAAESI
jgi:hypothetical protein